MRYLPWLIAVHSVLFALVSAASQAAAPEPQSAHSPTVSDNVNGIRAVSTGATGQAGYVHYFLITHPDGTLEDHVGIELEDQRIAWSFPGAGVIVSEFVKNSPMDIAGKTFFIEHLHGIRPFRTAGEMRLLQHELPFRVAYWIDEETPYCIFRQPGEKLCMSCGDFVARILFPATNALMLGLPEEFTRNLGQMPTTDDLLIYLLGLHNLPDAKSRLQQLSTLDLPDSLRDDVMAMLQLDNPTLQSSPGTTTASPAPARKAISRVATRKQQSRRL